MSGRRFQTAFYQLVSRILDPALCLGCAHSIKPLQFYCVNCIATLTRVNNPCGLCGLENKSGETLCAACLFDPPRWQNLVAPLKYQGLARDLLLQLKYADSLHLANSLVTRFIDAFANIHPAPEILLPVPLHRQRLLERGYNQAFEIARILSQALDIPVDTQSLRRIRNTASQSGLSAHLREKNILGAFAYQPTRPWSRVAVVDDIITTGSTASEITKTLHRAGCPHVEIWGLGRASKD
ncbi:MAG: ComF family protein [Gammaproteobacteria bacterium]|nr:ComF family protein [Gammaproteobacteria bacterium]